MGYVHCRVDRQAVGRAHPTISILRKIIMPPSALTFSLIIPAYNEEAGIAQVINDLTVDLAAMAGQYEVIVVNDGSRDRTKAILQTLSGIRVVEHPRNRGYGAALKTGMHLAQAPLIVITDADGSYPNGQIPHLVQLAQTADMVVGARIGANVQYSTLRRIPKWFLVRFAEWLTQTPIPDLNSGLRVFDKQIAQRFAPIFPDGFSFTTSITVAMLMNYCQVHYEPIDYRARLGQSKIRPIRDTLRFVQLILRTGMYFAPMRIFFPIALVLFGGFLLALGWDVFVRHDLTERSLLLLVASTQTAMFALVADMIDKRTKRL
jgi:glycosyltransferase involved in cell wall biosynthesis